MKEVALYQPSDGVRPMDPLPSIRETSAGAFALGRSYQTDDQLKANDLSAVTDILLIHLSRGNGDPKAIVRRVAETTGRLTYAARKWLELDYLKL